ncbi:MAG: heavy-metal-associated domain-containing protein [Spirochaetota bacterium]
MKYTLSVPDMSCDHCKERITQALNSLESTHSVYIDLDEKRVEVDSSEQTPETILAVIDTAGYDAFLNENL